MKKLHMINQDAVIREQRPYLYCKRSFKAQVKTGTWSYLEFLEAENKCKSCMRELRELKNHD